MRANAKQIARCTGGELIVEAMDPRELITGVSWDSREIAQGDLYVALPGERVDGHAFVADALRRGARAALVTMRPDDATCVLAREMGAAVIEVSDTAHAITDLARWWRGELRGTVVGVTGSTGKTTTKNLVRDVLAAAHSVVATRANQNNELGVPKTVLSADPETEYVVVEMGMRGRGQIEGLCDFVRPQWGIVTNVGTSHIELLGSRENIARAKGELVASLLSGGIAILNGADDMTDFMWEESASLSPAPARVLFDGSGNFAGACEQGKGDGRAVWAEDVELDEQGRARFTLAARGFGDGRLERAACHLVLRGLHNVDNACAAAAAGLLSGMPIARVAEALAAAEPESGRQEFIEARGGFTIINDAYNANPDSMRAALSTLSSLDVKGSRVAVLGDMLELGDYARACHEEVGRLAASLPIDCLVCLGPESRAMAQAALDAGMAPDAVVVADSVSEILGELDCRLRPGDAVLVKASHSMGLARVVEGLVR